jgi:hypothetical protein
MTLYDFTVRFFLLYRLYATYRPDDDATDKVSVVYLHICWSLGTQLCAVNRDLASREPVRECLRTWSPLAVLQFYITPFGLYQTVQHFLITNVANQLLVNPVCMFL